MQTEFTCGIYTAHHQTLDWYLKERNTLIGFIKIDGEQMYFVENISYLSEETLRCVSELMNNIKRQYKQLQTI
jgi:hypothetical protein